MLANKERINHFFFSGKFKGISGSSCDSQPTMSLSRSDTGNGFGANFAFLLLEVRLVAILDRRLFVLFKLAPVCTLSMSEVPFTSVLRGPALIDSIDYNGFSATLLISERVSLHVVSQSPVNVLCPFPPRLHAPCLDSHELLTLCAQLFPRRTSSTQI